MKGTLTYLAAAGALALASCFQLPHQRTIITAMVITMVTAMVGTTMIEMMMTDLGGLAPVVMIGVAIPVAMVGVAVPCIRVTECMPHMAGATPT